MHPAKLTGFSHRSLLEGKNYQGACTRSQKSYLIIEEGYPPDIWPVRSWNELGSGDGDNDEDENWSES